jgi:hypothetical protein
MPWLFGATNIWLGRCTGADTSAQFPHFAEYLSPEGENTDAARVFRRGY